jgi:tRNA 2-thiocytidine biosynthesis protein TtcA
VGPRISCRVKSIFKSTQSVSPSQLSDAHLYDFSNLAIERTQAPKNPEFSGVDIFSSNLIDVKNVEIFDASVTLP